MRVLKGTVSRDFLLLISPPPPPQRSQGAPTVSMTPVANLPPVSTTPTAKFPRVSTTPAANFPPVSTTPATKLPLVSTTPVANNGNNIRLRRHIKVNLKAKIYIYFNSTTQRCPNKKIKIFQFEDFLHLPPVSTTPVVHLELRIFLRIFEKKSKRP